MICASQRARRPRPARRAAAPAPARARVPATTATGCSSGCSATLPMAPDSPFALDDDGALHRDGVVVEDAMLEPIERPRFYDLQTADGIAVRAARPPARPPRARDDRRADLHSLPGGHALPLLHDRGVAEARARRRRSSSPRSSPRSPQAAVRLDGVQQLVMTTGTSNGPDRGARHLVRCVEAVQERRAGPADPGADRAAARPRAGSTRLRRGGRRRDRHPHRGARRGGPRTLDARQGDRPARALRRRLAARRSTSSAATASRPTCSSASARTPTSSSPARAPDRHGRLPVRRALPPARRARSRTRTACPAPDPAVARRHHAPRRRGAAQAAGMRGADQVAGCAACGACSALQTVGG